jgi:hypothetical protein
MLLKFTALIIATIIWVALIWLVLPFDFLKLSLPAIAALHALPPIAAWLVWHFGWRWYQRRKATALEDAEKKRAEEHTHQLGIAQKKFEQHLQERRAFIECRWIGVLDLMWQSPDAPPANTEHTQFSSFTPDVVTDTPNHNSWPAQALAQLFSELYSAHPIAASFPVQIYAPSNRAAESDIALVENLRTQAFAENNLSFPNGETPEIFLNDNPSGNVYSDIQNQFLGRRDRAGLVVIAFDKLWTPPSDFGDETTEVRPDEISQEQLWRGKPGGAVCALMFTQQNLQAALLQIEGSEGDVVLDHMLPHWDRQKIPAGISQHLSRLPAAWRQALLESAPIAHLHRSEQATIVDKEVHASRVFKISQAINDAAINAAMVEPIFKFEGDTDASLSTQPTAPKTPLSDCGWLVHNAGPLAVSGDRLAMLTSALWENGIELNPIDQATNTVITTGDTGAAALWLRLALAIGSVAANNKSTLLAEFESASVSVAFLSSPDAS